MIKFRKLSPETKEKVKGGLQATATTASLALGAGNFVMNQKRAKQDREYHKSQTEAVEKLTKALEEDLQAHEVSRAAKNYRRKVKAKPYEPYVIGDVVTKRKKVFRIKKNDKV